MVRCLVCLGVNAACCSLFFNRMAKSLCGQFKTTMHPISNLRGECDDLLKLMRLIGKDFFLLATYYPCSSTILKKQISDTK